MTKRYANRRQIFLNENMFDKEKDYKKGEKYLQIKKKCVTLHRF